MFAILKWNIICIAQMNMFLIVIGNDLYQNYTCVRYDEVLKCDYELPAPTNIPDGITGVHITDYKLHHIKTRNYTFRHPKWKAVKRLEIIAERQKDNFALFDDDLKDLHHLESLKISSNRFQDIGLSAFVGLYNLSYLDFSGCFRLNSRNVILALANKNNIFRLNYLKLDNIDSVDSRAINFDHVFYNMLYDRAVLHLSLRANTILLKDYKSFEFSLQMLSFDISNSIVSAIQDRSLSKQSNSVSVLYFENLTHLNISGSVFGKTPFTNRTLLTCSAKLFSLETVDLSHLITSGVVIQNVINISCYTSLRLWYFNSNTIRILNSTIVYPKFMDMLDLSWNGMEWISATALDGLVVLKTLNLSNNYLLKMENTLEFELLFLNILKMETIILNNNSLTLVPLDLFRTNHNLKRIILSDNKLESFDLNINHLNCLELLDLQRNRILCIESFQIQQLRGLIHRTMKSETMNVHTVVNLQNNNFQCKCETYKFIKWVHNELQPLYTDTYMYKCSLEEKWINIDTSALKMTLFLCYRTHIIVGSTICISVVILISGFTVLICYRKYKRKRKRNIVEHFLDQMIHGKCKEKYLTFISFCNEDILMDINQVEPALKTHMMDIFNIPKQFIVTGDSTFRVGFPILNEIMRCIKASCSIVCLISQSYCDSQWCQTELREAVEQDKPVVLLFLEDVKRQNMPEILWTLFNRNTRSKLCLKDGTFEPIAGWDNLCESIVTLASNKHYMTKTEMCKKRKRNESIDSEEEITFI